MKTTLKASVTSGVALLALCAASVSAEELTVYTAVEAEDLARYAEMFNQDHPDITINWVRDSTGVVTAKLLAEKKQPSGRCGLGTRGNLASGAENGRHAGTLCAVRA